MAENKNTLSALVQILTAQSNGFLWRHYYVLATPQEKEAYMALLLSLVQKEMKAKAVVLDQSTARSIRQLFADLTFEKILFENDGPELKSYVEEFFQNPVTKISPVFPKLQHTKEDKRLSADFFQAVSTNVPVLLPLKVAQPAKQLVNWTIFLTSGKITGTAIAESEQRTANSIQNTTNNKQPTVNSLQKTADGEQPVMRQQAQNIAVSGQQSVNSLQDSANRLSLTAVTLLSPLLSAADKQKALIETTLQISQLPDQTLFEKPVPLENISVEDKKTVDQVIGLEQIPLVSMPAAIRQSVTNLRQATTQADISVSTLAAQVYTVIQQQVADTSPLPVEQKKENTAAVLPDFAAQMEGIRDMALLSQMGNPPAYEQLPDHVAKRLPDTMAALYKTADATVRHQILQEAIFGIQNQVTSPHLMPTIVAGVASGLSNVKGKFEMSISSQQKDQKKIQEMEQDRKVIQNLAQQIGGPLHQQAQPSQPQEVQIEEEQEEEQTTSFSQQTSKWAMAGLGGAAVAGAAGLGGLTFLAASQTTLNTTTTVIHIISTSFFH